MLTQVTPPPPLGWQSPPPLGWLVLTLVLIVPSLAVLGNDEAEAQVIKNAKSTQEGADLFSRFSSVLLGKIILWHRMQVKDDEDRVEFKKWLLKNNLSDRYAGDCRLLAALFVCMPCVIFVPNLSGTLRQAGKITKLILSSVDMPSSARGKVSRKDPETGQMRDVEDFLTNGELLNTSLRDITIMHGDNVVTRFPTVDGYSLHLLGKLVGKCKALDYDDATFEEFEAAFGSMTDNSKDVSPSAHQHCP